ncbi:MAG: 2Fe-2S iron-sulfur cluster-binding protein [Pseudomonadota bacterium]
MAAGFHTLRVDRVRRLTPDAVAIRFAVPDALFEAFTFEPGQYVTLRADVGGADLRRSYSICSDPAEPGFEVGIKRVAGGQFSTFAQDLCVGDVLEVMPPQGRFTWTERDGEFGEDQPDLLLLVAAGSGITPCLSIVHAALRAGQAVTLIYGNSRSNTVMFSDDLVALKDRYTQQFSLIHCLSREQFAGPLFHGRIDEARITALAKAGQFAPSQIQDVFICGPSGLPEEASAAMAELGVDPGRVHVELFSAPGHVKVAPPVKDAVADAMVTVIVDGTEQTFPLASVDQTVLAAAQEAGLDLPFSCAGGMCSTCRCKVVEGTADMRVNYSLEDWETEQGFVLACQAQATSKALVLDFDAA